MGNAPINPNEDKRNIIVTFSNRSLKKDIQKSLFNMRDNSSKGVFVNELLLKDVNKLFYKVRQLKKNHSDKIKSVYTSNGVIKVRLYNHSKLIDILTEKDYNKFLSQMEIENS